jgi:hypothetical protein
VKRTFSDRSEISTGLPGQNTQKAGCQDSGDFDQFVMAMRSHTLLMGVVSSPVQQFHMKR